MCNVLSSVLFRSVLITYESLCTLLKKNSDTHYKIYVIKYCIFM